MEVEQDLLQELGRQSGQAAGGETELGPGSLQGALQYSSPFLSLTLLCSEAVWRRLCMRQFGRELLYLQ